MLLSLNWLKEFAAIPKNLTPEELAKRLTDHTVEVEKLEYQADKYRQVAVGKILAVKPHPKADRLRLALVDVGAEKLEIVCGAPNIAAGQLVPVALVGAVLPAGLAIKPAEIRGVTSSGMLCAPDELGLGDDHKGIMILDKAKIGQSLADYLGLNDVMFEVDNKSITHRADLWSHYGLARDISAFLNVKFKAIKIKAPRVKGGLKLKVKVEDHKLCPRYMALALDGIKVGPSPEWLANRLSAAGMRPINNIVDATNYVMLEVGQPLHAFDARMIDSITVRRANKNETMETLDGQTRQLDDEMLLITNQAGPVAIAGVMGGANSEINDNTTAIIIESANFNFESVRKTAQKLGLRTEASMRYEKGLDPNLTELGLFRAAELIMKICPGATAAGRPVDQKKYKLNLGPISFDLNWLNGRVGENFSAGQVKRILEKLGFGLKESRGKFKVTVPTWRAARDIAIAEDVVEEVARIYGYNNLKPALPKVEMAPPLVLPEKALERKIKNILSVGAGLTEVYNYSFVKTAGLGCLKLVNSLSEDLKYLRVSLRYGLIENIKTNQAGHEKIAIYEIGRIFLDRPGENGLPYQAKRLGLALAANQDGDLFRELKGIIAYLLNSLNIDVTFDVFEKGAGIFAAGELIGQARELDKDYARTLGIKKRVALAELELDKLNILIKNHLAKLYRPPAKYPPAVRDLAFVVNDKILYNNIVQEIKNFSDLIARVELFDVYQGDKLGAGKKSLAFHIIYQADKTLTSEEVDEAQGELIKHLENKLGAKVRNF
ncbi:MAG: phenylalanine--tRNA ligase subunit beta [bacterium]|nr:phenylalanine--tRNA ligase subunit beta [bacterium]